MRIALQNISKRYDLTYILKEIHAEFVGPGIYGIKGRNGSGKSTLLKCLAGLIEHSEGKVSFYLSNQYLKESEWKQELIFAAPYIMVTQDFSLREIFDFYLRFRSFSTQIDYKEFLHVLEWGDPKEKLIKHFSSGMQQKLSLALSILTKSSFITELAITS